jgi:hypothetical protein
MPQQALVEVLVLLLEVAVLPARRPSDVLTTLP